MAQDRVSRRGVTNVVTCAVLLLFGLLSFTAGCSSEQDSGSEDLGSQSQPQLACIEGAKCTDRLTAVTGVCHLGLCCAGCVINVKGSAPRCAPRGGVEDTVCGETGTTCKNCTADTCQYGACEAQTCVYKPVREGAACTDMTGACHNGDCCRGCVDEKGVCQPGGAIDNCGRSSEGLAKCTDCRDSNDCTAEACVRGACDYPEPPTPAACSDGDKCNGEEACSGTSCEDGEPLNCDDGQECTTDSCDGKEGCLHEPRTGSDCSDGDPCTTGDTCGAEGLCKKGEQINCDDSEFCTADSCVAGKCVNEPVTDDTGCNDNDVCTAADQCLSGVCKGTSANGVDCNDGKTCTLDSQVNCTSTACNHAPAAATISCIADKCHEAGHCSGTDDTCVPGPAIDCDDGNPCTTDGCAPTTGCTHVNNPAADCSDGDACTENDVCVAGQCGGKPKVCLPLDACHEAGSCDSESGTCDDPRAVDQKECPGGACQDGKCILDPNAGLGGEGAGGASGGAGGEGAEVIVAGGAGPIAPGGDAGSPPQTGDAGNGSVPEPDRPFIRAPGGCSCELPNGGHDRGVWLLGLAFLAGSARRRARRGRLAA